MSVLSVFDLASVGSLGHLGGTQFTTGEDDQPPDKPTIAIEYRYGDGELDSTRCLSTTEHTQRSQTTSPASTVGTTGLGSRPSSPVYAPRFKRASGGLSVSTPMGSPSHGATSKDHPQPEAEDGRRTDSFK